MTIRYEANPPKILPDINKDESIKKFVEKIKTISKKCDAIHLTENVLGHERVSPLEIGTIVSTNFSIDSSLLIFGKILGGFASYLIVIFSFFPHLVKTFEY